ncbi:MAG: TetR/AcrR family transcriptional regulator [Pseudomonadales bacterium]|nr:TetR family transcriptional regulator [Gammaproteobacteria bacterium]NNL56128.1 TetR/AcrR family transcriptional regulator [Pseudomonadales bacterium]
MKSNKQNILDAASALFLRGGAQALSVRAIASQAGVSTIGIYSHFDGKQGVLDALYIEGFELVSAALEVPGAQQDPVRALLKAARNYMQLAEQNRAHYRLIFGDSEGDYTPSEQARRVGAQAFDRLTEAVALALPKAKNKKQQQAAALQIWSLLHGSVSLRHHDVSQLVDMKQFQAQVLAALEILIAGLAR